MSAAIMTLPTRWGATAQDWAHWGAVAGCADMLPVVSNPTARISQRSQLKSLGKTPSVYDPAGEVVGIGQWTRARPPQHRVDQWAGVPDYGICLQTRRARAMDIDIPDPVAAALVLAAVQSWLEINVGQAAPVRSRRDSGKCLALFVCEGDIGKRVLVVARRKGPDGKPQRDMVELLATGQQCVVAGTHPAGARYEWRVGGSPGLPEAADIPVLTLEMLDLLWQHLVDTFAVDDDARRLALREARVSGAATAGAGRAPMVVGGQTVVDHFADWLEAEGHVLDTNRQGHLFVECPNEASHSSDNGPSQAAYLPAGTGGKVSGVFKCLHASCVGVGSAELKVHLGYPGQPASQMFQLIPTPTVAGPAGTGAAGGAGGAVSPNQVSPSAQRAGGGGWGKRPPYPDLLPNPRRGAPPQWPATINNLTIALNHPPTAGVLIGWDDFSGDVRFAELPDEGQTPQWQPFKDEHYTRLQLRLESAVGEIKPSIGKDMMRDAVYWIAQMNMFDSAMVWLDSLVWDGVPRVARFFADYLGTADTPYAERSSCLALTAQVGRIVQPGCQVDQMFILTGGQGLRKSSALRALVPHWTLYAGMSFDDKPEEFARKLRGRMVGEFDELKGLTTRGGEHIKSMITQQADTWTPKYKEQTVSYQRRCVFWGTSNEVELLNDPTGSRRFVIHEVVKPTRDDLVARDRDQLFAEAYLMWQCHGGVMWEGVEEMAAAENHKFTDEDPWTERIRNWLHEKDPITGFTPLEQGWTTVNRVLTGALGIPVIQQRQATKMAVGRALCIEGFVRGMKKVHGKMTRVYQLLPQK